MCKGEDPHSCLSVSAHRVIVSLGCKLFTAKAAVDAESA